METLCNFTPEIEVYSIDEAFLNLGGFSDNLTDYGRKIRRAVKQWTGIPVSIGIAGTKTLAKIAQRVAKRSREADGVFELAGRRCIDEALAETDVEKVWGVGLKTAFKLRAAGIRTARELRDADVEWMRQRFGVTGVRTVYELRGICCYELEEEPPSKKCIRVSRMFGRKVGTIKELKEAVASYASRAGEKLREEGLAAGAETIFVMTSRFKRRSYFNSHTVKFVTATNYTPELIECAVKSVERLYRKGLLFNKAGVILSGLVPEGNVQGNLFDEADRGKFKKLMRAVDAVNTKLPYSQLMWAAEGISQPWQTKFVRRSKRYTTRWDELVEVA
jgi:DNA polymerase V